MKCTVCGEGHVGNRRRVGPTGRELYNVLIDSCYRCGSLYPVRELDYKKARWVERFNKRMKEYYELRKGEEAQERNMQGV